MQVVEILGSVLSSITSLFGSGVSSQTSDYYRLQSSQYQGIDYATKVDTNNKSIKFLVFGFIGIVVLLIWSLIRKPSN